MNISEGISIIQIVLSFVIGGVGAIIGAVFAAFRVDKKIALLDQDLKHSVALIEQKIDISIDGPVGVVTRLGNIEAALNARKIPQ